MNESSPASDQALKRVNYFSLAYYPLDPKPTDVHAKATANAPGPLCQRPPDGCRHPFMTGAASQFEALCVLPWGVELGGSQVFLRCSCVYLQRMDKGLNA